MLFYRSDSLPSLHLTFADGEANEYRVRQGCVEFRANHAAWRLLEACDIQFHMILQTEVAKWLQTKSTSRDGMGVAAC
jgi:hypothetical protein